jgi:hypothetical protein
MTTQINLPKIAKSNIHFFDVVSNHLFNNNNTVQVLSPIKCKTQTGNLKYDGLNIYSYGKRIFYKSINNFGIFYYIDARAYHSTTPNKVKKHLDYLLEYLSNAGYDNSIDIDTPFIYDDSDDEKDDEDLELLQNNPKRHWLIHNIKCSVEKVKETCSIDLEEYDELIKTKCGHLFCDKNLYSWLKEHDNKTCPLCRTKLL